MSDIVSLAFEAPGKPTSCGMEPSKGSFSPGAAQGGTAVALPLGQRKRKEKAWKQGGTAPARLKPHKTWKKIIKKKKP